MSTLSNVETRRGEAKPPSVRLAPDTIPEAKSSKTGVSVRYVPDKKELVCIPSLSLATCNKSEYQKFVEEEQCHFKGGKMVRVVDGMFKGVEGRVARVSGQQRVVVTITDAGLVSTAYIPTAFLNIIEK